MNAIKFETYVFSTIPSLKINFLSCKQRTSGRLIDFLNDKNKFINSHQHCPFLPRLGLAKIKCSGGIIFPAEQRKIEQFHMLGAFLMETVNLPHEEYHMHTTST